MSKYFVAIGSVAITLDIDNAPSVADFIVEALRYAGVPSEKGAPARLGVPISTSERACHICISKTDSVNLASHFPIPPQTKLFRFEDDVNYHCLPNGSGYIVHAWGCAVGHIDFRNQAAEWLLAGDVSPRAALHLMVLDPLSLMLPAYGVTICHAAAVASPNGAALLFGKSGYGKSTLAFLLSHEPNSQGIQLLSDDTVILDHIGDTAHVYPICAGIGVADAISSQYNVDSSEGNVLFTANGKRYLRSVPDQTFHSHPVNRLVFLNRQEGRTRSTASTLIPSGECVKKLLAGQTSIPNPNLVTKIGLYQRLAQACKAFELTYNPYCDLEMARKIFTI